MITPANKFYLSVFVITGEVACSVETAAGREGSQQTAGMRASQLIDLDSVTLKQRLLELELQAGSIRRVYRSG